MTSLRFMTHNMHNLQDGSANKRTHFDAIVALHRQVAPDIIAYLELKAPDPDIRRTPRPRPGRRGGHGVPGGAGCGHPVPRRVDVAARIAAIPGSLAGVGRAGAGCGTSWRWCGWTSAHRVAGWVVSRLPVQPGTAAGRQLHRGPMGAPRPDLRGDTAGYGRQQRRRRPAAQRRVLRSRPGRHHSLVSQYHQPVASGLDDPDAPPEADRRPSQLLVDGRFGRLRDTAVLAGARWAPTTGHHPGDEHPPREIDKIYGTAPVARSGAVVAGEVIDTAAARKWSDTRPSRGRSRKRSPVRTPPPVRVPPVDDTVHGTRTVCRGAGPVAPAAMSDDHGGWPVA